MYFRYFLFADLVGSTAVKEKYPDEWLERHRYFISTVLECCDTINSEPEFFKLIGDAVFVSFRGLSSLLSIPPLIASQIKSHNSSVYDQSSMFIQYRIAGDCGNIHFPFQDSSFENLAYKIASEGPYTQQERSSFFKVMKFDPIGLPVDRCARILSKTLKNQVLLSGYYVDHLRSRIPESGLPSGIVNVGTYSLKGISEPVSLYELNTFSTHSNALNIYFCWDPFEEYLLDVLKSEFNSQVSKGAASSSFWYFQKTNAIIELNPISLFEEFCKTIDVDAKGMPEEYALQSIYQSLRVLHAHDEILGFDWNPMNFRTRIRIFKE